MCIAFPRGVTKQTVHSALWNWLAADAQRLLFAGAALQLLMLVVFAWTTRGSGFLAGEVSTITAYVSGALYGVIASVLFGLLMARFSTWTGTAPFHRLRVEAVFLMLAVGFAIFYLALWGGSIPTASLGIVLVAGAWLLVLRGLGAALRSGRTAGWSERWLVVAVGLGLLGLMVLLVGLLAGSLEWRVAGRCIGLWGFLLPVSVLTLYRLSRPA